MPDINPISTLHVEGQPHLTDAVPKTNLLTNVLSKKFEDFEAAVALDFAYYNFCKTHGALKMTPAMAAGIENGFWTLEDLFKCCGE